MKTLLFRLLLSLTLLAILPLVQTQLASGQGTPYETVLAQAPPSPAESQQASEWPTDAQSTTGPVPSPGIERGELSAPSPKAEVVLLDVPAYIWYNGCGPTAAGMVVGYWDGNGFDNLVSGSAGTQTSEVDAMMSSSGNYDDYCLPIDSFPNLLPDKSEPPEGDEHTDDCVADLMETSQSFHNNYYGWSWFSRVDDALQGYVQMAAPAYSATAENQAWGTFTWNGYRAEIDAGRPVVLLVDTDASGGTDHFVTAIGYSDESGTNMYACRNTWDTGVHWFEFAQMASGQPWGIYGATLFQIVSSTDVGPLVYDSHTVDDDNSGQSSGNDDGIVNCGETIELYVDLYNQGSDTATGVNATISTSDPYVTFIHNTSSSYPDIPGGDTGTNTDDFDFEVDPGTPGGHVIHFDLDISASNGGPWSESFDVLVVCTVCNDPFLVYLDGDNNLEGAGIDDFLEMSSVGSDSGVNIVVQFDRISGHSTGYGDWTTTKRFLVTPGMTPTAGNALQDIDEANMGDPQTLVDFVQWGMANYPADHYAIILWNHGDGWRLIPDEMPLIKGVIYDDTDGDHLDMPELRSAMDT
ncbi:MAG: hypothetical protein KAX26_01545, partial [Anaerolineae bacterium]|nr:hypothetical protein [Anaerolineae bacterium]